MDWKSTNAENTLFSKIHQTVDLMSTLTQVEERLEAAIALESFANSMIAVYDDILKANNL